MIHVKKLVGSCALAALGAVIALAVNFTALKPQGYVSDYAEPPVLDAASRANLERYCATVERATGVQIAVLTLPTLAGEPLEDVANDIFRAWGIGHKGKDDGILLMLVINDRRMRLEVGRGLEPEITDGLAGHILESMRPYLRQGRYADALMEATGQIGARIAQARQISLTEPAPQPHAPMNRESPLPLAVLAGGIVLFFLLSALMGAGRRRAYGHGYQQGGFGRFLPGLILGNMMGRDWGGRRGGGGFGGYDSSDGFGGFGGGDSGGGGASSDW